MDEPFASVDAQTRADLEDLMLDIRDRLGVSIVLVTHDIEEAVYLGDKVIVYRAGRPPWPPRSKSRWAPGATRSRPSPCPAYLEVRPRSTG